MKQTSVRLSLCLFHHSTAASACGGFAAERRAGGRHISIDSGRFRARAHHCSSGVAARAAGAQQQMRAVSRSRLT